MRYAVLILMLLAGTANAETFRCQSGAMWFGEGKIVVVTTINADGVSGTVKVAGTTHKAKYHVEGFDRRWDFGPNGFDYAFVLRPDGTGVYYDFSSAKSGETVKGSQVFACK